MSAAVPTREAALAKVQAMYPRKRAGYWFSNDAGDGTWEVTHRFHGRRWLDVEVFVNAETGAVEDIDGKPLVTS